MNFYKNHFGMVISSVVAICISFLMATCAIIVDNLTFSLPLLIKNWGTSFLVISLLGMIFPLTNWSFALGRKLGLKPETLPHILLENAVATFVFNTGATLVLAACNLYGNAEIELAIAGGFLPFKSVTDMYIATCLHDWPIMFVISFVAAFFVTKLAIRIAIASVGELKTAESPQNQ